MTPNDDAPDARSMELEIHLDATPEQVWDAIATGPGITSWLHPTELDPDAGTFSFDMGSGMEQAGRVTAYDQPERLIQEADWQPPGAERVTLASEWLIQAASGGTTVLRLVVSGFGSGEAWDDELEGFTESMRQALQTLRLYLEHFPGRHAATVAAFGAAEGSLDAAFASVTAALGMAGAAEGDRVSTGGSGAPPMQGTVEQVSAGAWRRDLTLLLDRPAPGLVNVSVWGEARTAAVHAYLFGEEAGTVAAREHPVWQAWMQEHFPTRAGHE